MTTHYQKAHFLLSVAEVKQLPPDSGTEVAIVGRSNAGKSSILNRITNNKKMARVSKTPGRTQMINLFGLDETHRLADLPGYSFAKVPLAAKLKWQQTVDTYIQERGSLRGLLLVMDIRHPLKELDIVLLTYCDRRGLPVHVLLNKADKLSHSAVTKTLREVKTALADYRNAISVQVFSALKGSGIKELHLLLDQWYGYKEHRC